MTIGLIRVGNLLTYISIIFYDTAANGVTSVLDISTKTLLTITFTDPDGNVHGPFDMAFVSSGVDGAAYYNTSGSTSLWDIPGLWRWFGTVKLASGRKVSTNDALHEVL